VPDEFRGKNVRCKQCATTFSVQEARPGLSSLIESATNHGKLAATELNGVESSGLDAREHSKASKRNEAKSRKSLSEKKSKWVALLVVFGALGIATLLLSAGVYFVFKYAKNATENLDYQTVFHGPTKAGEGAGRQPSDLDDALNQLGGGKHSDRPRSLRWLAKQPADLKRRAEIARALDPNLSDNDPEIVGCCLEALKIWATSENVPSLLPVLESGDPSVRLLALEVAAILKDERTIGPVANSLRYVPNVGVTSQPVDPAPIQGAARKTLSAIGKSAEIVVARFYFLLDGDDWAKNLLTDWKTDNRVIVPLVLEVFKEPRGAKPRSNLFDDLSAQARRQRALDWLTAAKPSEPERADVARALDAIVKNRPENDLEEMLQALKAMKTWTHPSNFDALCKLLTNRNIDKTWPTPGNQVCALAMEIIGRQKDERAAAAIAPMLVGDSDLQNRARSILIEMGSVAVKEVTKYLHHEDESVRAAAKSALDIINIKIKNQQRTR
jgi:HEAT repeat protein